MCLSVCLSVWEFRLMMCDVCTLLQPLNFELCKECCTGLGPSWRVAEQAKRVKQYTDVYFSRTLSGWSIVSTLPWYFLLITLQCLKYDTTHKAIGSNKRNCPANSIIAQLHAQCIEACSADQCAQNAKKKSFSYQDGLSWHLRAFALQAHTCACGV